MIDLFVGMVYNFSFSLPKTSEFFLLESLFSRYREIVQFYAESAI